MKHKAFFKAIHIILAVFLLVCLTGCLNPEERSTKETEKETEMTAGSIVETSTEDRTEPVTESSKETPAEAQTEPAAPIAQAIYTGGNQTLTFLYGPEIPEGEALNGEKVTARWLGDAVLDYETIPGWAETEVRRCIIDKGFREVCPKRFNHWFQGYLGEEIEGLENLNTSQAEDMYCMFAYSRVKKLDLSTFDTTNVSAMDEMFRGAETLEELDLSGFDTRNLETVDRMFSGCLKLRHADLSGFDTSKLTSFFRVFERCVSLVTIDLSSLSLPEGANAFAAFSGCESLETIFCRDSSTDYVLEETDTTYAYCESLSGKYGERTVPYRFEAGLCDYMKAASLGGYLTPKYMKIRFDANGGEGEMEEQLTVSFFYSEKGTAITACTLEKEGFRFAGWNTEKDGSGASFMDREVIAPKEDLTLYAQWEKN